MENNKTTSQRILEIYELANEHFGDAEYVGLKYDEFDGWVCYIKFHKNSRVDFLSTSDEMPRTALEKLKKRVENIIARYNVA